MPLLWAPVTPERSKAYGRLMKVVDATGEGALGAEGAGRSSARPGTRCSSARTSRSTTRRATALARVSDLAGEMVGAERWDPELAEQVLQDLEACGPPQLVRLGDSH